MVEHATRDGVDGVEMRYMNTIHCNELEGFFFGPLRFNYHAEHHLFPTVPSWRWSRLKHHLVEHPEFRSRVQVHHSYVGFLIRSLK